MFWRLLVAPFGVISVISFIYVLVLLRLFLSVLIFLFMPGQHSTMFCHTLRAMHYFLFYHD